MYGGFPPVAFAVAVPSHAPLHCTSDFDTESINVLGCPIVTETVSEQPFASVTVPV